MSRDIQSRDSLQVVPWFIRSQNTPTDFPSLIVFFDSVHSPHIPCDPGLLWDVCAIGFCRKIFFR
jgi:hypothetical protein